MAAVETLVLNPMNRNGSWSAITVPFRRMAPTHQHRVALVGVAGDEVVAFNADGESRTFDGDWKSAMRFSGVSGARADVRFGRRGRASTGDALAFWVLVK